MNKSCLHCHQKLGFLQAVRGELFCSSEHRELYFQAEVALAFERVTSFDRPAAPPVAATVPVAAPAPAEEKFQPLQVVEVPSTPVIAPMPVSVSEAKEEVRPLLVAASEPARPPEMAEEAAATPVVTPEPASNPEQKEEVEPIPVLALDPPPVSSSNLEVIEEPQTTRIEAPEPAPVDTHVLCYVVRDGGDQVWAS